MIKSFRHKGLERFFETGSMAGIQAHHAPRLRAQLAKLDTVYGPIGMDLPGWHLHPLKGALKDCWAVWVDKNWRMIFKFEHGDAVLIDYSDYH
ncbi:type II toxin-antitoxin system RelE/ParE family toxin [Pseudoduganella aquatica]|uniref:Peptidase n=1 Tax=Pseudoduganella aquatica TaxID=2660641 RepID=A0A7X4HDT2_9BURK|nr:type II toxin-antitoxin system RelE/ParE family toxin [Pseudoduganella aquatica]MYN09393.1 peptidase [Pseudoduganella aquatica]